MRLSDSAIDVFIFKLKSTIKYYSPRPGGAHGASETVEQAATAGRVLQGGDVEARVVVQPVAGRTRTVWRPGVTGRGGREGRSHHSRTTGRRDGTKNPAQFYPPGLIRFYPAEKTQKNPG